MHSGHRQRMREKMLAGEDFPPHELLEMLLGFAIPRKNTNDIAHRLLERFGSLEGVFGAPYGELIAVRGMGVRSAFLMRVIFLAYRYLEKEHSKERLCLDSLGKLGKYAEVLFGGMKCEAVYAVLLDSRLCLVDCIRLAGGSSTGAEVGLDSIVNCPSLGRSAAAVILHNHPEGDPTASEEDRDFVARAAELFAMKGVEVIEHLVVAGDRYEALMGSKELI